ncbi:START domain-containing protein [Oceaniserpentilla sp. 4NH20-0058]|uniref:START domain-containing protein n=1 Tax=Oceaniserpentilla sp. 4NH20-0058 TaxID=3127660 RepID=UPI003105167D
MKYFTLVICSIGLMFSHYLMAKDTQWVLEASDEDKNIQIYTRAVAGSDLKEFKGVTLVKTDINALVALLMDEAEVTKWMHNIAKFEIKENISDVESIVYTITETPWPVANRDSYVRSVLSVDAQGVVTLTIKAEPTFGPIDDKYVRISSLGGSWKFTPKVDGLVEVIYQMHANPGGSLPNWLVNSIVVETPLETLSNLHVQVKQEKYQNQTFVFIQDTKISKTSN